MEKLAAGGMLSGRLSGDGIRARLNGHLAIAALNAPSLCVVAGPFDALDTLEAELKNEGVATRRLAAPHHFHLPITEPVFGQSFPPPAHIPLRPHQIPCLSLVSGTWRSA